MCHINCFRNTAEIRYESLSNEHAAEYEFSDKMTLNKAINGLIHASLQPLQKILVVFDMAGAHQQLSGSSEVREFIHNKAGFANRHFFLIHVNLYTAEPCSPENL
jgi:hypothetical protein